MSKALGGVCVLQKGPSDIISIDTTSSDTKSEKATVETVNVDVAGGLKRCAGQGDILSGTVGAALAWGKCYEDGVFGCVPTNATYEGIRRRFFAEMDHYLLQECPFWRLPQARC